MSLIPIIPDSLNFQNQSTILPNGNSLSNYRLSLDEFVLLSLLFQFFLVILGRRRKTWAGTKSLPFMIAAFYLYAITVANYAMGLIPDKTVEGGRTGDLRVFWAPFLIVHLGGPTSITAVSLADNELWLRYAIHLLTLSYTFGRVFLRSDYFLENDLWVPTLMVFLAGAIKYVERVICLFNARLTKFRDSTLPTPDPGVNYARLMHTYSAFKQANFPAEFKITSSTTHTAQDTRPPGSEPKLNQAQIVKKAYDLFRGFNGLFVNLAYSYSQRNKSRSFFLGLDAEDAFGICAAELNLAYDVFYTKALLLYKFKWVALLINLVTFFLQLASLVLWIRMDKSPFHRHSVNITHAVVCGSLALDLLSFLMLVSSDWVTARIDHDPSSLGARFLYASHEKLRLLLGFPWGQGTRSISSPRRWSGLIPQFNVISVRIGHDFTSIVTARLGLAFQWSDIGPKVFFPDTLRSFLFYELKARSNLAQEPRDVEELCSSRGMWALSLLSRKYELEADSFGPWIADVKYEESLVLWHIATTLCYTVDDDDDDNDDGDDSPRGFSKIMSEYMLQLLVMDPKMMPPSAEVLGWIVFRDTCGDVNRFLRGTGPAQRPGSVNVLKSLMTPLRFEDNMWLRKSCQKIIQVNTDLIPPRDVRGQQSKSVLFDASILAKKLQLLDKKTKWEVISKVWAEMLFYAAAHSRPNVHVQKLPVGGELLTLVWLLMAHLGLIGKHFRHNKAKDRRARLVVIKHN